MFLDVYFGEQLVQNQDVTKNFLHFLTDSTLLYFLIIFGFFFVLFIVLFFITPLFKNNPKSYYKRYLQVRSEMQKIDSLYNKNEINFEDYVFAQFNYAKEYEQLVFILSKIPEYKQKLASYKIALDNNNVDYNALRTKNSELKKDRDINFLYELLLSKAKYYTAPELSQAIIDEGFANSVAQEVINRLKQNNVQFNIAKREDSGKVVNFINSLMGSEKGIPDKFREDSTIDIRSTVPEKETSKNKFLSDEEQVHKFKHPVKEEVPKGVFGSMFGSKKKPSVSEIRDIFSEIEKSLKEE